MGEFFGGWLRSWTIPDLGGVVWFWVFIVCYAAFLWVGGKVQGWWRGRRE